MHLLLMHYLIYFIYILLETSSHKDTGQRFQYMEEKFQQTRTAFNMKLYPYIPLAPKLWQGHTYIKSGTM